MFFKDIRTSKTQKTDDAGERKEYLIECGCREDGGE